MDNIEQMISLAAKFHGIDVPVMAIREESGSVIITVQGGTELRCKFHDLMTGETKAKPSPAPAGQPAQPAKKPPQSGGKARAKGK